MDRRPSGEFTGNPQDEKAAIKTIRIAIDLGMNWIDTAPFYGWGRAEQIVGKAIKGRRDQVYIFTKCGTLPDGRGGWSENLKPESVRKELKESLQRLQTDCIDLYQFHDPDPRTPIEESWTKMQHLIDEGKVRYGGLSQPEPIQPSAKDGRSERYSPSAENTRSEFSDGAPFPKAF